MFKFYLCLCFITGIIQYIYIYLFADEKPKLPKNKMKMREKNVDPTAYTGVSIYSINEQEIILQ